MNEDRKRILKMVAEGKLSIQEAEELLEALSRGAAPQTVFVPVRPKAAPKYLYVKVMGRDTVDVRIPLGLLRAGMRFTSLIPKHALDHMNTAMHDKGFNFDVRNLKPEDLDMLIQHLADMEINVKSRDGDDIKVFCGE